MSVNVSKSRPQVEYDLGHPGRRCFFSGWTTRESLEIGRAYSYPLNPADNVLLAAHESLRRRGYCGLNVMLCAELEGELEPFWLKRAVSELGVRYPGLSSRICYSALLRRAFWHIPGDASLEDAIEYEHCTESG